MPCCSSLDKTRHFAKPCPVCAKTPRYAKAWAKRGDVFIYFISGAKVRAPAAAQALIERV